ncbi:hypothetical protein MYAM1_000056 [Malassezia yamatoensis]|uniref:CUE domain-containing protein n=1 Tax=Malassezia yamatoensis TaxID=253288 RepID=A0AAJ6CH19_9BASI|nr:hypothetical protein MYAM1_000056 [Malassezia yamatoensis]
MTTDGTIDMRELSDALGEDNSERTPESRNLTSEPNVQREKLVYAEQVAQLQSMFPKTEAQDLDQILARHHGNIEAAMPSVLELSDPDFTPTADDRRIQMQSRSRNQGTNQVPQQQWDPSQLRYSPRVPRGSANRSHLAYTPEVHASTPPPVPMRPSSTPSARTPQQDYANPAYTADGVTQHDTKKIQEDLKRLTESTLPILLTGSDGLAKVGTTLFTLRRKAQTAMQKLEQERQLRAQREQMQSNHAQASWTSSSSALGQDYDQDPLPVQDNELDRLMHSEQAPTEVDMIPTAPNLSSLPRSKQKSKYVPGDDDNVSHTNPPAVPAKPKTHTPLWGQRYAASASRPSSISKATVSTTQASSPSLSWADVGVNDAQDDSHKSKANSKVYRADQAKKDAQQQIQVKLDEASQTHSLNQPDKASDASNAQRDVQAVESEATQTAAERRSTADATPSETDLDKVKIESQPTAKPSSADSTSNSPSAVQSAQVVPESESDEDSYVHNPFDDDD